MSNFFILCAALVVLPLCGTVVIDPVIAVHDVWQSKEFFAILFILLLTLNFFRSNHARQNVEINYPLYLFILFVPISIFNSPPMIMEFGHVNMGGIWLWQTFGWIIFYFLLYICVTNIPLLMEHRRVIFGRCIAWPSIISSVYAIAQALHLDQFYATKGIDDIGTPVAAGVTAMIGNPTYLGVYLALSLPFCYLYARRWIPVVILAIILSQSDTAWAGMVFIGAVYAAIRARSNVWLKIGLAVAVVSSLLIWAFWSDLRPKIHDNGRFYVWQWVVLDMQRPIFHEQITEDMSASKKREAELLNQKTYVLTGFGPGSFPFFFTVKHGSKWGSAHCEPMESMYCFGAIGAILIFCAIAFVLVLAYPLARGDPFFAACYASFFFICLASFNLPLWHVEPSRFISAVLFGLLSGGILKK